MLPKPITATVASFSVPMRTAFDWSHVPVAMFRTASGTCRSSASSSATACSATVGAYASPADVTVTPGGTPCSSTGSYPIVGSCTQRSRGAWRSSSATSSAS